MEEKINKLLEEIKEKEIRLNIDILNPLTEIKWNLIDIKTNTDNKDALMAVKRIEKVIKELENRIKK